MWYGLQSVLSCGMVYRVCCHVVWSTECVVMWYGLQSVLSCGMVYRVCCHVVWSTECFAGQADSGEAASQASKRDRRTRALA